MSTKPRFVTHETDEKHVIRVKDVTPVTRHSARGRSRSQDYGGLVAFTSTDRQIVAIAVPAFAALISEPLMLIVDTAIIGHLGSTPLAGLAAAGTVLTTIVGLCIFLAYSNTASVSRHMGAGETRRAYELAVGGLWLAIILGTVLALATRLSAAQLAEALSSSPEVATEAHTYLSIAALAIPAMLIVLAATGALRGVMDLRTPLVVMIAANILNAVLTASLVVGLDFAMAGAAWGLVIAQWFAAVWLSGKLLLGARNTEASKKPRFADLLAAALDGAPLFVRTISLRVVLLLATLVAANMSDAALAAHQIATTVVTFWAFALDAIAIAAQTLLGNALGASDAKTARDLTRRMMGWGAVFGVLVAIVTLVGSPVIAASFTSDASVRAAALPALIVVALIQPISGVVFVLDGVLIGAGDGKFLAVAATGTAMTYLPLALIIMATGASFTWLWIAYGWFQMSRFIALWWRQRSDSWLVLGAGRA